MSTTNSLTVEDLGSAAQRDRRKRILDATIALLLHRRAWPLAIVAGFGLSAAVEYAQASIPGRVPDLDDVVWNTLGAVVGVAVVTVPRIAGAAVVRHRAPTDRPARR